LADTGGNELLRTSTIATVPDSYNYQRAAGGTSKKKATSQKRDSLKNVTKGAMKREHQSNAY
jgi:hypothetical protein